MTRTATLITGERELAALVPAWTRLWERTPGALPFQHPAWLMAWWRAFRPGVPRVAAVWEGERLAGLLPLYRDNDTLRLIGAGTTDLQDMLAPDDGTGIAAVAFAAVGRACPGSRIDLFDVVEGSALLTAPLPAARADEGGLHDSAPVLALPDGVPAAMRRAIRHARSRADRMGGATVEPATADSLPALMDALVHLHGARWSERGDAGVYADPRMVAFHREAAAGLLVAGLLRLFALRIGGRLAAVHYGLHGAGQSFYLIGGFDPDLAWASPGTLAVAHAIEEAVREGATAFHFLRGREAYKFRWGAVDWWTRRRGMVVPG